MQDFDEPSDRRNPRQNQSRRHQADDDDEDDICAMMDRFNK